MRNVELIGRNLPMYREVTRAVFDFEEAVLSYMDELWSEQEETTGALGIGHRRRSDASLAYVESKTKWRGFELGLVLQVDGESDLSAYCWVYAPTVQQQHKLNAHLAEGLKKPLIVERARLSCITRYFKPEECAEAPKYLRQVLHATVTRLATMPKAKAAGA